MSNAILIKKEVKRNISSRGTSKCNTCKLKLEGIDGGRGVITCDSNLSNCPSYRKSRTVK